MNSSKKTYNLPNSTPIEFELKDITDMKKISKLFSSPSKAISFCFIWISEGTMSLSIDFREITLNTGDAILIVVNQIYKFNTTSEYQGKIIQFSNTFFNQTETDNLFLHGANILNPIALNQIIRFPNHYIEASLELLSIELKRKKDFFQPEIVNKMLSAILLESERYVTQTKNNTYHYNERKLARIFFDEVELCFKSNRQVDFYICKLAVCEKTLAREIKKIIGKTPKQYIDSRIILEAKRLLISSSLTATEICFELGWDEATNFNKFFRKHTGYTPIEFRKNMQQMEKCY